MLDTPVRFIDPARGFSTTLYRNISPFCDAQPLLRTWKAHSGDVRKASTQSNGNTAIPRRHPRTSPNSLFQNILPLSSFVLIFCSPRPTSAPATPRKERFYRNPAKKIVPICSTLARIPSKVLNRADNFVRTAHDTGRPLRTPQMKLRPIHRTPHAIVRFRDGIVPLVRFFVVVHPAADCGHCPLHPPPPELLLALGDPVSLGGSARLHPRGSHPRREPAAGHVSVLPAPPPDSGTGTHHPRQ